MFKIIKSKKVTLGKLKFNSQWERSIYKKIYKILPKHYHPIKINQRIEGFRFELDIYIPKLNLAFELQGPFHFQNLKIINRDLIKARICKKININIVYLFYNKNYSNIFFQKIISANLYKCKPNTSNTHITTMEFDSDNASEHSLALRDPQEITKAMPEYDSDNASEHSLVLSESCEKPQKKTKRVSTKHNKEQLKIHREELQEHYKFIKSIQTEIYQPISIAIKAFKDQCPSITVHDSSIKRHIIKHYTDILDCKKVNNRWMCGSERVNQIKFDLTRYKKYLNGQQRTSSV